MTNNNKCFTCGVILTAENSSDEHIIPNALGGKLKLNNFLCNKCNNSFFHGIDTKLAKDCEPFANFLNIGRDRGVPQNIKAKLNDEVYSIKPLNKPEVSKPLVETEKKGDQLAIKIKARNMKEAKKILEGLQKKYPKLDIEKALSLAEEKKEYLNDFLQYESSFGGNDLFRALTKIVMWTLKYRHPKFPLNSMKILPFLKGEEDYKEIYYYYPNVDIVTKPAKKIYHSIVIKSYPEEKLLVGFIEIFNVVSAIMILSDDFEQELECHYVFDVLERQEVVAPIINYPNINLKYLNDLYQNTPDISSQLKDKYAQFLAVASERQNEGHIQEMIDIALKKSLMKYPKGTTITKEMVSEFVNELMKEITPWLHHNMSRKFQK